MTIKYKQYNTDVYIADFTEYNKSAHTIPAPVAGVYVDVDDNGIISSFLLTNKNHHLFNAINLEENKTLLKREDGTLVSQCECILHAIREDSPAWMIFLELKYCKAKNRYSETLEALGQLKKTCDYVVEKSFFERNHFKRYFVVSTPGVEPLDPFDDTYFNQDEMLTLKEEYHAQLLLTNQVDILTPVHLRMSR